ncbi:restriction endonuclease fold toxin-2 domain-containing protein [Streptomyces sp. NRRL S-350]|uniref:restriction endonuclease fold toxin-2 domain-containing protein n=1 Tax=Streptomyces sp. NRRL S-350 TaxID=1463902 RepID=UPI0004BFC038|nr:restriction endonuclease fold toxin-2 domain-containing protein [Streptomyces sp. NRRL S-350]
MGSNAVQAGSGFPAGPGTGFHVVPADMLISSAGFTDLQTWASQIHRGLVGSMDAAAGMAGDDDAGHSFAAKYDPVAQAVVTAVGQAVAHLGGTANGLYTMAMNYIKTDADVAADLMQPQQLPQATAPGCDQEPLNVRIPSAVGHNSSAVDEIIAQFWPQGDPDKLRQAGSDWQNLGRLVNTLGLQGNDQVQTVTATSTSSAVDGFTANWSKMYQDCVVRGPLLNSISDAASKLSAACNSYAQAIDDLRSKLQDLAVGAGIVAGVGIGLTIFTLGISDAAAAGGEAAIAGEAGAAALAMTAGIEGSAELAVLAEAEAIVNEAAAGLSPVAAAATVTAGGTAVVLASAGSASAAAPAPGPVPGPGVIGPIAPDPTSPFHNLSPQQLAEFQQWMTQMEADGRTTSISMPPALNAKGKPTKQQIIDARAYQLRIAGDTEYSLYTTETKPDGSQWAMDADGIRPQDGAAIEAKYVSQKPGNCSPYRIDNVDGVPDFLYRKNQVDQQWEMERYGSAINDPRNKVNHVEIDTNDPKAAAYFEAMRLAYGVPGQTRVVQ